ncbi:sulfotransferase family 2 domain-containing protein [Tateyamaria sp. syn59]|uniref:sulfotransferase family 2 domain-containing protein n=1 Tax=Tateyamaria sp. syn59 TaxID=2576942 RepID=UPI0011BD4C18|nr:sulfotransferase family 2 domain-containing protein [Tateyamaria sp. syn59]
MLISHSHKFIFIKSPKSGGTSVERLLQHLCVPSGETVPNKTPALETECGVVGFRGRLGDEPVQPKWYHHQTGQEIHDQVPPDLWRGYFKFSVVRNPFSRILSQFLFRLRVNKEDEQGFDVLLQRFDAFLDEFPVRTQETMFKVNGAWCLDFAIRFEDFASDVDTALSRIGAPALSAELAHLKPGNDRLAGSPVADFFNTARTRKFLDLERSAFEQFRYSTDPADAGLIGQNSSMIGAAQ